MPFLEGFNGRGFIYDVDLIWCSVLAKRFICKLGSLISCSLYRISSRDTGKTMVDASLGEIMTTCEKITWLLSEGEKWLKPEYRYIYSYVLYCHVNPFIMILIIFNSITVTDYVFMQENCKH